MHADSALAVLSCLGTCLGLGCRVSGLGYRVYANPCRQGSRRSLLTCDSSGRMVMPACPPTTGTSTSFRSSPFACRTRKQQPQTQSQEQQSAGCKSSNSSHSHRNSSQQDAEAATTVTATAKAVSRTRQQQRQSQSQEPQSAGRIRSDSSHSHRNSSLPPTAAPCWLLAALLMCTVHA